MPPVRRLTAILAADVAGYSRLMGADEEGTHERLKAHLAQLVYPKIAEHRGRVVKNTGDGFLAEFASVIDAVRCAVEVQRGMAERNAGTPSERRIEFRVGINLGDVIVEEHNIFGDGVNVAARLEDFAEPGGICVSRIVRDQVRDKLNFDFEDIGEQSIKNIARPVRVYALRPEALVDLPTSRALIVSQSAGAPRLSIVVLPFANLSNDPEQGYFADGITEDLTTDLSRIAGMFAARAALEAAGCTLKEYYFALGPADVVVTYEAPDAIAAASVSMILGASGASSSVETIQLFTMEEAMTAMTKAGQVQKTYKPPAAG